MFPLAWGGDEEVPDRYDVIVVGGGAAGMAAALAAEASGARVGLFERSNRLGGDLLVEPALLAVATDPGAYDAWMRDRLSPRSPWGVRLAAWPGFSGETVSNAAWLASLGVRFLPMIPEASCPTAGGLVPLLPNGPGVVRRLARMLVTRGAVVRTRTACEGLLIEGGRVSGVRVRVGGNETREIRSRGGVVLAMGGAESVGDWPVVVVGGADKETLSGRATAFRLEVAPRARPRGERLTAGLRGLQDAWTTAGAYLRPLPGMNGRLSISERLFREGAILLNAAGERFCNEERPASRADALARQSPGWAFLLLDTRLYSLFNQGAYTVSVADVTGRAYVDDYLRHRPDITMQADAPEALAALCGMNSNAVCETVERFNAYTRGLARDTFGRRGDVHALEGLRWVMIGPLSVARRANIRRPSVDREHRVLGEGGLPVPGLYGAGGLVSGPEPAPFTGLDLSWALYQGRAAGVGAVGKLR